MSAASAVTSLTDAAVNAAQTVQAATGASTQSAVAAVTDHLDPSQGDSAALRPDDGETDPSATAAAPAGTAPTNSPAPSAPMSLTTPVSPAPAS